LRRGPAVGGTEGGRDAGRNFEGGAANGEALRRPQSHDRRAGRYPVPPVHRVQARARTPAAATVSATTAAVDQTNRAPSPDWSSWISGKEYQAAFDIKLREGFYPARVEGAQTSEGARFRAAFERLPAGAYFYSYFGLTEDRFAKRNAELASVGFHLIWTQTFVDANGQVRYQATCWMKQPRQSTVGARGVLMHASASRTPRPAQLAGAKAGGGPVATAPNPAFGGPQGASGKRSDAPTAPPNAPLGRSGPSSR